MPGIPAVAFTEKNMSTVGLDRIASRVAGPWNSLTFHDRTEPPNLLVISQ